MIRLNVQTYPQTHKRINDMNTKIGVRVDPETQERLSILSVVLNTSLSELVRSSMDILLEKHKGEIDAIIRVQKGVKQ